MGNDQPDETDQSRHRDRGAHHQRRRDQQNSPVPLHRDSQLLCGLLPQRQKIQASRQRKCTRESNREKQGDRAGHVRAAGRKAPDQPKKDPRTVHQTRERGQENDGCRRERVEHDPGQQQMGG